MNTLRVREFVKFAAIFLLTTAALGGCASDGAPPPASNTTIPDFAEDYRIGVGDTLSVSVWRNDDLSITAPVRPDGKISVPLAGDVLVGDKTPEEVSAEITEKIGAYIRDPFVTVAVTNMGSTEYRSRVRVTGAVDRPVSLPYRQGMTVLDVVLEAGGINEFANGSKSTLFRRSGERFEINLDRLLKRGDMSTNFTLQPGDVITVPERAF
ncbi:MAG TPA: XrtA/PEP-CTERM system exopolysaccharide export protein [Pseudomonadales bacterium]|jgi:polysaccharide export outer membrane protein